MSEDRTFGALNDERGEKIMPLRPLERRLLVLVQQGRSFQEMGPMFRRSPEHLERCYQLANLKLQRP